ncbi:MAG: mechanosensitive ion channel, partial [Deltaproteobacteria bacterium]|nr:mechanosensitive ion channel [Deltaproteobacteria bacterium]
AVAQPPAVTTALENRLTQGSPEEITTFINQRLVQLESLTAEIDKLAAEGKAADGAAPSPDNQVTSLKDFYNGISLQYRSLLAEIGRETTPVADMPSITGPPYALADFDRVIAYQQQVNQQRQGLEKRLNLLGGRLGSLKEQAVNLLSEYAKLSKTSGDTPLQLYQKYGELISLQGEYALLICKKPKAENRLHHLNQAGKLAGAWVDNAFTELKISEEDLVQARRHREQMQAQQQEAFDSTSSEYQDLNRRIVIYEAQLDSTLAKITENKDNDIAREGWQIEKERTEMIIDALKLRINLINQRRLNGETRLVKAEFRLAWLEGFGIPEKRAEFSSFISLWSQTRDKLVRRRENVGVTISDTTVVRSHLTQRLVWIQNKEAQTANPNLREALQTLSRQGAKVNENIDKLIMALADNEQEIKSTIREFEQVLGLIRYAASYRERLLSWVSHHWDGIREKFFTVLYYPLFSLGSSTIDLLIIIKILVLFVLGIILLRLMRLKIATLLVQKAALSPGAVNSITTLGYYAGLLVGAIIILSSAGLDLSQLSIILGALGVGIGFGLQTITNNFISGIILLTEQTVKVGDLVTISDGLVGEVKNVSIRTTVIRTIEGEDIIVPNSDLISNRVNTWTYGDDWRRLNIPFGVSYDSDPDEVVRLAEAAAREVSITREDFMHPLKIFFEGFGDNSLDFSIRVWCRMTNLKAPTGLKSEYYFALFRKFKQAGITIPFPQRDLHLQSASPVFTGQLAALLAPEKGGPAATEPGKTKTQ